MDYLRDHDGKQSTSRALVWFVVVSGMALWGWSCIRNGYAEPGWSFAALIGAAMGAKAIQGIGELAGKHFGGQR